MKELRKLRSLQFLDIAGTEITDSGLKELKGLISLKTLDTSGTAITNAGLTDLAGLSSLESLGLNRTQITDAAFRELTRIKSLKLLGLGGTRLSRAGVKAASGAWEGTFMVDERGWYWLGDRTREKDVISAADLMRQYLANEVAADINYKDKTILVSGIIQNVGKDILDTPYVAFQSRS